MQTITVKKQDLYQTIRENRDSHRETFLAAQVKYRERVVEELDRRLENARNGRKIDLVFRLPEPEDYTSHYDTALAMLEWEIGEEVELEREDFDRYVLNKWEWARHFAANTQSYLAS